MKRTTIMLEDDLFRTLKKNAVASKKSFKEYLNNLIKSALYQKKPAKKFKLKWITVEGGSLPAVSIDDRDRLYDFLDSDKAKY